MPRHRGPTYQLERVPPELLRHVKARPALEGHTVRAVVLALLEEYAAGTLTHLAPARVQSTNRGGDPVAATVEPRPPMPFSSAPGFDLGF
jgi:hypothetical protein